MKLSIQHISLILGLSLLFSACVPAAVGKGNSIYNPLETNERGIVNIPEGQTSYIRHTVNPKRVGITASVSNDLINWSRNGVDNKGDTVSRYIQNTFQSIDVDTILGVEANVKRVSLVREVIDVDKEYLYFEDYVEIILEVVLPEDSSAFPLDGITLSFTNQGETYNVPIFMTSVTE